MQGTVISSDGGRWVFGQAAGERRPRRRAVQRDRQPAAIATTAEAVGLPDADRLPAARPVAAHATHNTAGTICGDRARARHGAACGSRRTGKWACSRPPPKSNADDGPMVRGRRDRGRSPRPSPTWAARPPRRRRVPDRTRGLADQGHLQVRHSGARRRQQLTTGWRSSCRGRPRPAVRTDADDQVPLADRTSGSPPPAPASVHVVAGAARGPDVSQRSGALSAARTAGVRWRRTPATARARRVTATRSPSAARCSPRASACTPRAPSSTTRAAAAPRHREVGLDDEKGAKGTVAFEIWADGKKAASTGRLTNADARTADFRRTSAGRRSYVWWSPTAVTASTPTTPTGPTLRHRLPGQPRCRLARARPSEAPQRAAPTRPASVPVRAGATVQPLYEGERGVVAQGAAQRREEHLARARHSSADHRDVDLHEGRRGGDAGGQRLGRALERGDGDRVPARAAAATAAAEVSPSGPGRQPLSSARRAMFGPLAIRSTQPRAPHGQRSPSRSTLMWPMCPALPVGPGCSLPPRTSPPPTPVETTMHSALS